MQSSTSDPAHFSTLIVPLLIVFLFFLVVDNLIHADTSSLCEAKVNYAAIMLRAGLHIRFEAVKCDGWWLDWVCRLPVAGCRFAVLRELSSGKERRGGGASMESEKGR